MSITPKPSAFSHGQALVASVVSVLSQHCYLFHQTVWSLFLAQGKVGRVRALFSLSSIPGPFDTPAIAHPSLRETVPTQELSIPPRTKQLLAQQN
jgi:hypothetical protein